MLEKSFGLLFYLEKPKNYVQGPIMVYLRITVDGGGLHFEPERSYATSSKRLLRLTSFYWKPNNFSLLMIYPNFFFRKTHIHATNDVCLHGIPNDCYVYRIKLHVLRRIPHHCMAWLYDDKCFAACCFFDHSCCSGYSKIAITRFPWRCTMNFAPPKNMSTALLTFLMRISYSHLKSQIRA